MKKLLFRRLLPLLLTLAMLLALPMGCAVVESALQDQEFISFLDDFLSEEGESVQEQEPTDGFVWKSLPDEDVGTSLQELPEATEQPVIVREPDKQEKKEESSTVVFGEDYSSMQEVADYLHLYGELPPNFLTKSEAQSWGWDSQQGNLWDVAEGMSIGGDRFGNYEGALPDAPGRRYRECDINYQGGYRGPERIIYSNDGLIYYTADHYKTFTLLYGGN